MTAKEQMSKLLDQLMGQNRDGKQWDIGRLKNTIGLRIKRRVRVGPARTRNTNVSIKCPWSRIQAIHTQ